jgi:hypothetical protein
MDSEERDPKLDQRLDQWLDDVLAGYSKAEPRSGLEQRITATLRAEDRAPASRRWWMILTPATAAVAALVVTVSLYEARGVKHTPTPEHQSATVVSNEAPSPYAPPSSAQHRINRSEPARKQALKGPEPKMLQRDVTEDMAASALASRSIAGVAVSSDRRESEPIRKFAVTRDVEAARSVNQPAAANASRSMAEGFTPNNSTVDPNERFPVPRSLTPEESLMLSPAAAALLQNSKTTGITSRDKALPTIQIREITIKPLQDSDKK